MSQRFPPYAFVPGYWPHPTRDPTGHSYNATSEAPQILVAEKWENCHDYLRGFELFNHGYYWEAHESWEGVWNALQRNGSTALLLKALIKLAAVGVKIRQQAPRPAKSLLQQVRGHLAELRDTASSPDYAGLNLERLIEALGQLTENIEFIKCDPTLPVEIILPAQLLKPQ